MSDKTANEEDERDYWNQRDRDFQRVREDEIFLQQQCQEEPSVEGAMTVLLETSPDKISAKVLNVGRLKK